MSETKTPIAFMPLWQLKAGPLTQRGDGLLSQSFARQPELVDEFKVFLPSGEITVKPRVGQLWRGSQEVRRFSPSKLVWCRIMQQEIGSRDNNSAPARCVYYGVGLEGSHGRHGFRVYEDGRAVFSRDI